MGYLLLCVFTFVATYLLTLTYTSVFYHRGLTHRAIRLSPSFERFVVRTGNWVTGIDPKTWVCMHRLHHAHADTPKDPHSPHYGGFFRLILVQLWSYGDAMDGLRERKAKYTSVVRDLKFPINWLNRNGFWYWPHLLHLLIGLSLAYFGGMKLLGFAYFLGMMSHPIQGWAVNAFGHRYGYRNFRTKDKSTNYSLVAWLVLGEGYQNNHHHRPSAANFSVKPGEMDMGYFLCRIFHWLGLIQFPKTIPARTRRAA